MPSAGERKAAADILAKAKARVSRVKLVLDGDLLAEHERLNAELEAAPEGGNVEELAQHLIDLEEQIRKAEIEFVFRGIGRGRWRKLLADHPPSDEDKAAGLDFSQENFPFAAMAASIVSPTLSEDDLRELDEETFTEVDFQKIWTCCLRANVGAGVTRPESRAAHAILANGRHSSPQPSDSE
jgi:hypothetical protein